MCQRRRKGYLSIGVVLGMDMAVVYYFFGANMMWIISLVLVVYVFFAGEWLDIYLFKQGIPLKKLSGMEEAKLHSCSEKVVEKAKTTYHLKYFSPRFYMIPNNTEMNAYAFGHKYIGINQAALQLDEGLLQSIIAHEIGHVLSLDATLNRMLFVNLMAFIGIFFAGQYMLLACIMVAFGLFSLFGMFQSWISVYLVSGLMKGIKKLGNEIGHIFLIVYQTLNCLRSRRREYAADKCAYELGYGTQLVYFLRRFAGKPRHAGTLTEALYDTHPLPQKRIVRIEQYHNSQYELENHIRN